MFSHKHPGLYSDRCIAAELSLVSAVYRDRSGVIRWRSNAAEVPASVVRIASFYPEAVMDITPSIEGRIRRGWLGLPHLSPNGV